MHLFFSNEKAENDGAPAQQSNVTPEPSSSSSSAHAYDNAKMELGLFYCVCGKNCNTKKSLQAHITYNKRDRKFPCKICGSRFPFQSFLSQHLERSHKMNRDDQVEVKPRPTFRRVKRQKRCSKCGKSFKTQVELFRHNKLFQ